MTSGSLVNMLAEKHAKDVFVAECKNGPTQTGSHRRLDAWVLLKTWSPITTIGYEVKVDRTDFRTDTKIADYLPLCHQLYLVAPKGLIQVQELPEGVGLMEAVGTKGRLVTRRHAPRRVIELPARLMVYVLMCRARITREQDEVERHWQLETLRAWVANTEERHTLSQAVHRKIRAQFDAQDGRLREMARRLQALEHVEKRISELGFDVSEDIKFWSIDDKLRRAAAVCDVNTLTHLEQAERMLRTVRMSLDEIRKKPLPTPATAGGECVTDG